MKQIIKQINQIASKLGTIKIMEVCGGHTHTIMKYGLRDLLPNNIKLISGPGCPVCVSSKHDVDCVIKLAQSGVKIATYGDMLRVPGSECNLQDAKAAGADIKTIYSTSDVLSEPDRVFFAIGFETTTPMTAFLLKKGIKIFSSHKLIPPAMKILVKEMDLDGFIDPGHVSAIMGENAWHKLKLPAAQVIAGFEPEQLLSAILLLLKLIQDKKQIVVNGYPQVVSKEGNKKAQKLIQETMKVVDSEWRGFGVLKKSGLDPINQKLDAKKVFADLLTNVKTKKDKGCCCPQVIRGLMEPKQCPLFAKTCSPQNPQGACMVSLQEGACAIAYQYGRSLSE